MGLRFYVIITKQPFLKGGGVWTVRMVRMPRGSAGNEKRLERLE